MITFFSFLHSFKIFIKLLLSFESYAVKTLHLWIFFVTTPISTSNAHQFKSTNFASIRKMWPTAQVFIISISIKANSFSTVTKFKITLSKNFRICCAGIFQIVQKLQFIGLIIFFRPLDCFINRNFASHKILLFGNNSPHRFFNFTKVFF